jgi:dolichol-phosphate mannosyltransferase
VEPRQIEVTPENAENIRVSFLIPVFNEQAAIPELYRRLAQVADALAGVTTELVFVDDNSSDETLALLRDLNRRDGRVKVISFSRNFGHQLALTAGLRYVSGDCTIILDGDLQDPPELAPKLLEVWKQGNEVVFCVRRSRQESFPKQLAYQSFYRLLKLLSPIDIPLDSGDFCLIDRKVVEVLKQLPEDRPFIRGLRAWAGFRQTSVEYDRPGRELGETKYDIFGLARLALDGLISFSDMALRVSGMFGMCLSILSITYAGIMVLNRILIFVGLRSSKNLVRGWTTIVSSVMLLLGLQFMFLGIIGEYLGRIFLQTKNRPLYILKEEIGFAPPR